MLSESGAYIQALSFSAWYGKKTIQAKFLLVWTDTWWMKKNVTSFTSICSFFGRCHLRNPWSLFQWIQIFHRNTIFSVRDISDRSPFFICWMIRSWWVFKTFAITFCSSLLHRWFTITWAGSFPLIKRVISFELLVGREVQEAIFHCFKRAKFLR